MKIHILIKSCVGGTFGQRKLSRQSDPLIIGELANPKLILADDLRGCYLSGAGFWMRVDTDRLCARVGCWRPVLSVSSTKKKKKVEWSVVAIKQSKCV